MTKSIKTFLISGLAIVLGLSMTLTPVITERVHGASTDDITYEELEGEKVEQLKKDEEKSILVEDPELYRYYEVDDKGKLREKEVELDEVDKFIKEMDENAEGISDTTISEMSDNMSCVGCGVSGLGKAQIPSKYSKYKRYNCLDISWWQGNISADSWKKIKKAGVTHVIIRSSYTSLSKFALNMDSKFANNVNRAYDAGIKVGVYHFSQATTVAEAEKEAAYTLKAIENYKSKIKLPVVLDFETNSSGRLNMSKLKKLAANGTSTKICNAFCEKVKAAGYTPMVYANYTMLNNYMDYKSLQKKYRIWLANYTTKGTATTYPGEYWMWQYSSSGKVNGLSGCIDMNYIFDNGQGGSSTNTSTTSPADETDYDEAWETANETNESGDFVVKSVTPYKAMAADDLNYRTGPGTNYSIVGTFNKGKILNVVGVSGKWFKLRNGYFVKSSYTLKIQKARTTKTIPYRKGPGTNYKKVGTYEKGKLLNIVQEKNGWAKLRNGYYVKAKYTKKL